MADPYRIFVSYANKDRRYVKQLKRHLGSFIRAGKIELLIDRTSIQPGGCVPREIADFVAQADRCLLLLSTHFVDSSYIQNNELPLCADRAEVLGEKHGFLIPVFVSSVALLPTSVPLPGGRTATIDFYNLQGFRKQGNTPKLTLESYLETSKATFNRVLEDIAIEIGSWIPRPTPLARPAVPSVVPSPPAIESPPDAPLPSTVQSAVEAVANHLADSLPDEIETYWLNSIGGEPECCLAVYQCWVSTQKQSPIPAVVRHFEDRSKKKWTTAPKPPPLNPHAGRQYGFVGESGTEAVRFSARHVMDCLNTADTPWSLLGATVRHLVYIGRQGALEHDHAARINQALFGWVSTDFKLSPKEKAGLGERVARAILNDTDRGDLAAVWAGFSMENAERLDNLVLRLRAGMARLEAARMDHDIAALAKLEPTLESWTTAARESDDANVLRPLINLFKARLEWSCDRGEFGSMRTFIETLRDLFKQAEVTGQYDNKVQVLALVVDHYEAIFHKEAGELNQAYDLLRKTEVAAQKLQKKVGADAAWIRLLAVGEQIRVGIAANDHQRVRIGLEKLDNMEVPPDIPPGVRLGYPALWRGMAYEFDHRYEVAKTAYDEAIQHLGREKLYYNWAACLRFMVDFWLPNIEPDLVGLKTYLTSAKSSAFRHEGTYSVISIARDLIRRNKLPEAEECLKWASANIPNHWQHTGRKVHPLHGAYWLAMAELRVQQRRLDDARAIIDVLLEDIDDHNQFDLRIWAAEVCHTAARIDRAQGHYGEALQRFRETFVLASEQDVPEIAVSALRAAAEITRTWRKNPLSASHLAAQATLIALEANKSAASHRKLTASWELTATQARITWAQTLAELGARGWFSEQMREVFGACKPNSDQPAWQQLYGHALLVKAEVSYRYRNEWKSAAPTVESPHAEALRQTGLGLETCVRLHDHIHAVQYVSLWATLRTLQEDETRLWQADPGILTEWNSLWSTESTHALAGDPELLIQLHTAEAIVYAGAGFHHIASAKLGNAQRLLAQLQHSDAIQKHLETTQRTVESLLGPDMVPGA